MLSKQLRDKLLAQSQKEIIIARRHKQKKISRWHQNENIFYGVKPEATESRANIELGRAQEFINTYLSKIDNPLRFKFGKRKESQLKRVKRLNALVSYDANNDFWDLKDIAGKKQALIYGRAVYAYYADSHDGYKAHLENVDVYDFLIDPAAGGLDIEKAKYCGRYGVTKDASELKDNETYIKAETKRLLESGYTSDTETSQEETNKKNRRDAVETKQDVQLDKTDKFTFWEWYTTYEGERYYLLMQENGVAIRVEKLTDIFPPTKHFPRGAFPFWSYAYVPDLTEFWTPAPLDQVREIFMAQNVTINQMLDNAEEHNKPMKAVDISAIENTAELKYRKGGLIRMKPGSDFNRAVTFFRPTAIDTPLRVFQVLETIQEKASGVTAGAKGVSGDEKVGIYEGNQANTADRFGLLNRSYSFGYKRFAQLYELNVRNHLTKKVAVDIMGPEGVETEEVSKRDIFRKDDDFTILVEASDAEQQASQVDQKNKLGFLTANFQNPVQNPRKAYEIGAKVAGFDDELIKELMDISEYGNASIMSEAARDIEDLLDGKRILPNHAANTAYKQKFVDYLKDHQEDLTDEQFNLLVSYIQACEQIIMSNTNRELMSAQSKQAQPEPATQTGTADLLSPVNQTNGF